MIVVDTTVWVDFFNDRSGSHVATLVDLVERDDDVRLTDVILTEILQGLRNDSDVRRVEQHLGAFDILRLDSLDDFRRAAELYRTARRAGVTVRRTLDCLIASLCVREEAPILHNDGDFDLLATCTDLAVYPANG
ncbi:MAG: PIN domain nuclease [Acidimicrobiia bacterium]|nr:PIN domain nuclease [Acidimicrobiia bacterium]